MPFQFQPRLLKQIRYYGLGCLAALLSVLFAFVVPAAQTSQVKAAALSTPSSTQNLLRVAQDVKQLVQSGTERYQAGQFATAIALWEQAIKLFEQRGDRLNQSAVSSNLALAYQQLGHFPEANQAIQNSLNLLQGERQQGERDRQKLLAQTLNIQGNLQLLQGQAEAALQTREQATALYQKLGDQTGYAQSLINQSHALRALGLYPRALDTLKQVEQVVNIQPDSQLKANALLNLGNVLRFIGDLKQSSTVLQQSWAISQRLNDPDTKAAVLMSLGNTSKAQSAAIELSNLRQSKQYKLDALKHYEQSAAIKATAVTTIEAKLNQLSLLIEMQDRATAKMLVEQIHPQIAQLPPSRTTIYAQINFAQQMLRLQEQNQGNESNFLASGFRDSATLLATAIQQAKTLSDVRAESYALGYLGGLYEQTQQWSEAQRLTEQALVLARASNANDIAYRWQWQLGRVLQSQWEASGRQTQDLRNRAIAAYSDAVDLVGTIRNDLISISQDVQFSFRESVEPVYRDLVGLLLAPPNDKNQDTLKKAREVIESLQLAELDNFFRESCLSGQPTEIDKIDRTAAVIYPIILRDRLEVVVSLPDQSLDHFATVMPQQEVENLFLQMRRSLRRTSTSEDQMPIAQKLYDLLIRRAEPLLKANQIKTLTFVLDGPIKNVPMAALHDGNKYLLEKYRIAVSPGLQLLGPRSLQPQQLKILLGGLSEARHGFDSLPDVKKEVAQIRDKLPLSEVLLNETFTSTALEKQIKAVPFPVVHLATHGLFSSNVEGTFISAWDQTINVRQLGELLQSRQSSSREPIELLVLSACQTAAGDKRAALGLAGVAVKSGARSTLATLWSVEDAVTLEFMLQFYQTLAQPNASKAEALRQAQIAILQEYPHPYNWAPFILVGNWL